MLDWLRSSSKDTSVSGQLAIELVKWAVGWFGLWKIAQLNLNRADEKDRRSRQAAVLDQFHKRRIENLVCLLGILAKMDVVAAKIGAKIFRNTSVDSNGEMSDSMLSLMEELYSLITNAISSAAAYGHIPGTELKDFAYLNEAVAGAVITITLRVPTRESPHLGAEGFAEGLTELRNEVLELYQYETVLALDVANDFTRSYAYVWAKTFDGAPPVFDGLELNAVVANFKPAEPKNEVP